MVLGVGRFLVPPAFAAAGVMLIAGRPRHEPARAAVGLVLALASVAGSPIWPAVRRRLGRLGPALAGAGG